MGLWEFDGQLAHRIGSANAADNPDAHVKVESGEELLEAMQRKHRALHERFGPCTLHEMKHSAGQYYPRMARPRYQNHQDSPGSCPNSNEFENELASSRGQLVSLMHHLERICETIHPCEGTFTAFGHDIRNLLILACTEVEAHWRSVLVANGVDEPRFTTADYVKLAEPMRLGEYAISLPYYPWLDPLRPFENWDAAGKPTKDLEWYDAYNAVKHNRVDNFDQAKLIYVFQAVSACAIMLCAQFGKREAFRWRTEFGYFFQFAAVPKFDPSEAYIGPYEGSASVWSPTPYPFV